MAFNRSEQDTGDIKGQVRYRVEIEGTKQWVMCSSAKKRRYQIMVYCPSSPAPPEGFPVIYVLDGNSVFGTMVEAIRLQSRRPDITGVIPSVIVGIGYETKEPFSANRYYDYTPMTSEVYRQKPDGTPIPEQGGAAAFLQFLEEELKPGIQSDYPVNPAKQTIFGHSLGGLFTLYVLFNKPLAFQTYISGSASIHWNWQYLQEVEQGFESLLKKEIVDIKLLLAFGELEKSHVSRNSDRAKEMAERLSKLSNRGIHVEFKEFEGEGHVSVLPVLISKALRFSLS